MLKAWALAVRATRRDGVGKEPRARGRGAAAFKARHRRRGKARKVVLRETWEVGLRAS